jgi:hypothetical protein
MTAAGSKPTATLAVRSSSKELQLKPPLFLNRKAQRQGAPFHAEVKDIEEGVYCCFAKYLVFLNQLPYNCPTDFPTHFAIPSCTPTRRLLGIAPKESP